MKTKWLALIAFIPSLAIAQPAATKPKPAEIKLTIHPMATARPALKYRLLPEPADQTTGNAAPLYLIAAILAQGGTPPNDEALVKWLHDPVDQIPRAQANQLLTRYASSLHQVELAARREDCHWDLPYRSEGFNTLLPYLSPLRLVVRLLALQARLQIADGKYEEAAHTLQTGFGMAYHLNHDAFLIQILVAAGMDQQMLLVVDEWVSRPGAPNLYWALTNLPQPMCDIRGSFGRERAAIFDYLPHFREALAGKITGEQLEDLMAAIRRAAQTERENLASRIQQAVSVAATLPAAKTYLLAAGHTQAELDAMEAPAVVGLYFAKGYDEATQEMFKFASLPFWQTDAQASVDDDEIKRQPQNTLITVFLPSTRRAAMSALQPSRHVEELRVIEAIRAYAMTHDGKAPATLDDVALPIPLDPGTGKAFLYSASADGFTLEGPVPKDGGPNHGQRYLVQIQK